MKRGGRGARGESGETSEMGLREFNRSRDRARARRDFSGRLRGSEGHAHGRQAVEHGVGSGGAEFGRGVGAGGDGPAGETGVVGGGDVEGGVADEECGGGVGGELAEDVGGECRLGLEPGRVFGAEVAVEKGSEAEVRADQARGRAHFVGENGELRAAGVQGLEQLKRAGEEYDVVEHRRVPVGAVDGERLRDARRTDERREGVFESSADGGADLRQGRRKQAELAHRVTVAAMDGGEVVDERAVEVEEDGGEA